MAWNKNGTPVTLTGTGSDMDITDLTAKNFHVLLTHILAGGGDHGGAITFDNDTSSYADRRNLNGGTDATDTSQSSTRSKTGWNDDHFQVMYIADIDGEETLTISFTVGTGGAGAGNDPNRIEVVSKYDGTSQFTRVDIAKSGADDFAAGSNVCMLGSD
jgi:hypothetical protein